MCMWAWTVILSATFFKAYFHESKTVTVYVNAFNEASYEVYIVSFVMIITTIVFLHYMSDTFRRKDNDRSTN